MRFAQILKDKKLNAALIAHMKKSHTLENYDFLVSKASLESQYKQFIDDKGKDQVNLPGKLFANLKKLAASGDFKGMKGDMDKAKKEILKLVETDVIPRFRQTKEFAACRMGDPKKAAKLLGISNVKLLTEAMTAVASGNRNVALKKLDELAKKEKIVDDSKRLLASLEKAGLV